jgi:hypothetical protein
MATKPKPKVMKNGAVSDAAKPIKKTAAKKVVPKGVNPRKDITKTPGWMGGRGTI